MLDASPLGGASPSDEPGAVRAFLRQHHFLVTFAALSSLMGVSVGMAQVTTSLYAVQLQSSASMLGLIAAAQSVGVIFMSLPVGVLADRLGPSRPFVFGTAAAGLLYAGVSFARSPLQLLLCTAAISCFMPFRFVALNTLFLQQLVSLGESKAGWYRGTHNLGMFLIGPLLGAYLVSTLGSSSSYWFIALAFGLTILLSPRLFSRYSPRPVAATGSAWQALRAQVSLLLQDRALGRVSLVEGAAQATSAFFTFFIPILGVNSAGMSARQASTLLTAKGISYIFALFFLGGPLGRLGPGRGYAASFGVIAIGLALLGNTAQPPLLWLGSLVLGLGLGSVQIATLTRYAQIGSSTGYGKVSGFNALVGPTGGVLGGLVGGSAAHWFGLQTVFLLAAGAFSVACGRLLLGQRSRPQ
jgi:predicted MFS family arabinose efflux permease